MKFFRTDGNLLFRIEPCLPVIDFEVSYELPGARRPGGLLRECEIDLSATSIDENEEGVIH